jgi:hypothetical protein
MRRQRPDWLRWERVYGELGLANGRSASRRQYREYLEQRLAETLTEGRFQQQKRLAAIRRGWCLGSSDFEERMKERLLKRLEENRDEESWAGEAVEALEEDLARKELDEGTRRLGYSSVKDVHGLDCHLLARWIRRRTKVSVKWIAEALRCKTAAGLRSTISRVGRRLESDTRAAKRWKALDPQRNSVTPFFPLTPFPACCGVGRVTPRGVAFGDHRRHVGSRGLHQEAGKSHEGPSRTPGTASLPNLTNSTESGLICLSISGRITFIFIRPSIEEKRKSEPPEAFA